MRLALLKVLVVMMPIMIINAYADNIPYLVTKKTITEFGNDVSMPTATVSTAPTLMNNKPVSASTASRWQNYNAPLRQCIKGNTIIPSNGKDMLSYLFNNQSVVNVSVAVKGMHQRQCEINFSEGTLVRYCCFDDNGLNLLLTQILNDRQFDNHSNFAKLLATDCQDSPFKS